MKIHGCFKNIKYWHILSGVIVLLLIALILAAIFGFWGIERIRPMAKERAGETAIKYINENVLEGASATLGGVEKKKGIYLVKIKVGEQEYDSYITFDGRYLFPSGFDLAGPSPAETQNEEAAKNIEKREAPEVHLYTMSFCPYGNQAEEVMYPVEKLLGQKVKIEPHYVIYSNYRGGGPDVCLDKENKYCSMHGIDELKQDVRELCVYKYEPEKYWDFLMGVNKKCNLQDIEICWEGVAKEWEIDTTQVKNCQKNEALTLLEKEVELNKKYGVTGSPAILINGTMYQGSRTPEGYKTGICSGFQNPPAECGQTLENTASGAEGGCR